MQLFQLFSNINRQTLLDLSKFPLRKETTLRISLIPISLVVNTKIHQTRCFYFRFFTANRMFDILQLHYTIVYLSTNNISYKNISFRKLPLSLIISVRVYQTQRFISEPSGLVLRKRDFNNGVTNLWIQNALVQIITLASRV